MERSVYGTQYYPAPMYQTRQSPPPPYQTQMYEHALGYIPTYPAVYTAEEKKRPKGTSATKEFLKQIGKGLSSSSSRDKEQLQRSPSFIDDSSRSRSGSGSSSSSSGLYTPSPTPVYNIVYPPSYPAASGSPPLYYSPPKMYYQASSSPPVSYGYASQPQPQPRVRRHSTSSLHQNVPQQQGARYRADEDEDYFRQTTKQHPPATRKRTLSVKSILKNAPEPGLPHFSPPVMDSGCAIVDDDDDELHMRSSGRRRPTRPRRKSVTWGPEKEYLI